MLTLLGYQILELIERLDHSPDSRQREKLNESIKIPDRDFNMSLSFFEQQGFLTHSFGHDIGDVYTITDKGREVIHDYEQFSTAKPMKVFHVC